MPPLPFNPFGKKDQRGQSGGKEGLPSGGGPPAIESSAVPAAAKPERQLTPLEIAKNEIDTAFSPFMDELETQQNPEEPFFVRFGCNKGEKDPKSTTANDKGARADTRVILLIAPNAEGAFTAITRRGPKENKPENEFETRKIQEIIDQCLTRDKNYTAGGYDIRWEMGGKPEGKEVLVIGYDPSGSRGSNLNNRDVVQHNFDPSLLSVPSAEAVIARIQASKELAHEKTEETQKPLRDAQEAARKSKESAAQLSGFLKNPPQPPTGEGPAAPPPQSPTGRVGF